jgi:hypothetical protein
MNTAHSFQNLTWQFIWESNASKMVGANVPVAYIYTPSHPSPEQTMPAQRNTWHSGRIH